MSNGQSSLDRRMILVLGMHRSGTSAVAGTLSHLGVNFGTRLVAPAADNPKGFFEHADVWQLDHGILESFGSAWDDPLVLPAGWQDGEAVSSSAVRVQEILQRDFGASPLAGIKDPRMCRLMPLWRQWLRTANFRIGIVLVIRQPVDVIASLASRDELPPDQAAMVWLSHVLEAERDTRSMQRAIVQYENLMRDWRSEMTRVATALDIAWPSPPDKAGPAIDAFLESDLRHHRGTFDIGTLSQPLGEWVKRTHMAFTRPAGVDVEALDQVSAGIAHPDQPAATGAAVLRTTRLRQHQLQRGLKWCDDERLELVAGNQQLRENLERHVEELAKTKQDKEELRENLEQRVEELAKTKQDNEELRENLERHVEELAKTKQGNEELRENLERRVEELAKTRQGLRQLRESLDHFGQKLERAKLDNQAIRGELSQVSANLAAVYASRSWRITRPVRGVSRLLRGIAGTSFSPRGVARSALSSDAPEMREALTSTKARNSEAAVIEQASDADTKAITSVPAAATSADHEDALKTAFAAALGPRVLIVSPDILGPIRNGGIGTAFAALAQTLAHTGHAVTILYTLGGHTEGGENVEHWQRHYAGLGICFVPVWLERGEPILDAPHHAWRAYRVYLWLKQNQADYDLAYFPEWKGEAYYALQTKRIGLDFARLKIIVVTHSSTTWADSGNYVGPQRFDDLLLEFLERRSVEMADALISPSQYMLGWMRRWGWRWSCPTHVIQNLMPDLPPDSSALDTTAFAVTEWVFFGRLERRKGLIIFLDALARMPAEVRAHIQVTFLGKAIHTPDYDSNWTIQQKLGDWALPPKLIVDYGRDEAIAYLEQPGRVAVIASLVENSPYTVLECVLKHIPFIAADVGGIAELVYPDDRGRALFKPTPADLAAALLALDGSCYLPPRPAVPAAQTRQRWFDVQDRLLREIPEPAGEPDTLAPHITVCLVHYNRPGLLAQAIDSLRQQTYGRFDVVLVDDGSPSDEALQYLDGLGNEFDWRGWTIVRQANGYLGAARNNAVRHARGDYVLFMDDDNLAKPNELATFARAARITGADILTTVSDIFSDADGVPGQGQASRQLWIPLGSALGLGVFRNIFGDANALVRRETFLSLGGFTEDYGIGHEDWEFFARAVIAGANLQLVPEPLFWYRTNAASMLRGGDSRIDNMRSVRPYWEGLANGIGPALAYAMHMHHRPTSAPPVSPPLPATTAPASRSTYRRRMWLIATGVFRPHVRARFRQVLRESGWRGMPSRVARYVGLTHTSP